MDLHEEITNRTITIQSLAEILILALHTMDENDYADKIPYAYNQLIQIGEQAKELLGKLEQCGCKE